MMITNIDVFKDSIISFLNQLCTDISNEKVIGKNNRIHDLENYVKDFLNILHNLTGDSQYVNINTANFNSPGVDLYSPAKKEYIQITANNSSTKFKDSIDKTSKYLQTENLLESEYTFIFFSVEALKCKNKDKIISKYSYKEVSCWNMDYIIRLISSANIDQLERIDNIIKRGDSIELTVLEKIILKLSEQKLQTNYEIPQPFLIKDKIDYNQLDCYKAELLHYTQYSSYIETIIQEYENNAEYDIKNSIVMTIFQEYSNIVMNDKIENSDEIMYKLIGNIRNQVKNLNLFVDVNVYVMSLIAYVFCQCRIFKKPN